MSVPTLFVAVLLGSSFAAASPLSLVCTNDDDQAPISLTIDNVGHGKLNDGASGAPTAFNYYSYEMNSDPGLMILTANLSRASSLFLTFSNTRLSGSGFIRYQDSRRMLNCVVDR